MNFKTINLAIFASGNGSNAENIVQYFANNHSVNIKLILTNNPQAGVIDRIKKYNLELIVFNKIEFYDKDTIIDLLRQFDIDYIILAGFLWLIPQKMIDAYKNKIINIHPALLPNYGGKGMYGHYVHQKVVENRETKTGITIHIVNEEYDKGKILFQATCPVLQNDTAETIADKVHRLEYQYFPQIILSFICSLTLI